MFIGNENKKTHNITLNVMWKKKYYINLLSPAPHSEVKKGATKGRGAIGEGPFIKWGNVMHYRLMVEGVSGRKKEENKEGRACIACFVRLVRMFNFKPPFFIFSKNRSVKIGELFAFLF